MAFIIEAKPGKPGEGSFRAEKTTRKDAVMTAVGLVGQGMEGVTITDEKGRVYGPDQFRAFFEEGDA